MFPLSMKLFSPKDDKLDQFWIDFNLGSECISFFIDDQQVSSRAPSQNQNPTVKLRYTSEY